nr:hypothetical protein [Tanacetum cinerariifolium]
MDSLDAVESCGFCDATFEDKNSLITHIKLTHDGVEQQDGNQFVNDDDGVKQHDQQDGNQFVNDD